MTDPATSVAAGDVVYKYELRPWSIFLDMPRGARLLHVGAPDHRTGYVWALVDPEAPKVTRKVFAQPTGVPLPRAGDGAAYVGTFKVDEGDGWLIFHVFDGGERDD
jgi:hypothetical protein